MDIKKILLGLVALVVVVACSAGVSVMAMMYVMDQQKTSMTGDEMVEEAAEEPALYVSLAPIVVNYTQGTSLRYLQLSVELMTRSPDCVEAINTNMPDIRNALILQLSGKSYEMLVTREGKENMRTQIQDEVNLLLKDGENIESVLITSFVMQ